MKEQRKHAAKAEREVGREVDWQHDSDLGIGRGESVFYDEDEGEWGYGKYDRDEPTKTVKTRKVVRMDRRSRA